MKKNSNLNKIDAAPMTLTGTPIFKPPTPLAKNSIFTSKLPSQQIVGAPINFIGPSTSPAPK